MKILRQLLGKKSEPETLSEKIQKIADQPASSLEAIIKGSSGDANDLDLRLAALEYLSYGVVLREVALEGGYHPALEKAARLKLAELLDQQNLSVDALLGDVADKQQLLAVAAFCQKTDLQSALLDDIDDQQILADLCVQANSSAIRQSLAIKIEAPELLKPLAKAFKSKDKNAYKLIKSKLDAFKEQENHTQEIDRCLRRYCDEMMSEVTRTVDRDYVLRIERIKRRWNEIASHASDALVQRYRTAAAQCEVRIEEYQREQQMAEAFQTEVSDLEHNRRSLLDGLWSFINEIYAVVSCEERLLNAHRAKLEKYKERWSELKNYGKPEAEVLKDFTRMCEAVAVLLKEYQLNGTMVEVRNRAFSREGDEAEQKADIKLLNRFLFPIQSLDTYESGESVQRTIAILQSIDADYAARRENQQKAIRSVSGLIRKANQAIQQGRLKQAIGIRHSIEEKIEEPNKLPGHQSRQLENLDEAIQKLVDWQSYAVVPKKQALIESMESLVDTDLPPEALAIKIKKLQDEWKSLSQSGKDRHEALWEKFSEVADNAYQPCKVYYQDLAAMRKSNLGKRQQLVMQLEAFFQNYDWEDADWQHVEKVLRTAREELKSYSPIDRAANKPVYEAFEAAMSQIQEKLHSEFEKNKAAKQQLIDQAEKLDDITDLARAIDTAKRLQVQWKKIGRCQPRDHDRLWKNFRLHCDAVFDKKGKHEAEKQAAMNERIGGARALIEKLDALAQAPLDQLPALRNQKEGLQDEFNMLDGIPEKVQRALSRDFNKSMDRFDNKLKRALKSYEIQAWRDFFDACKKINDFQFSVIGQNQNDETQRDEVETYIASVQQWPESTKVLINQKLNGLDEKHSCLGENVKALKLLCIRAEIMADKPSPEDDQTMRMEYRVNLLQQGIAQAQKENTAAQIAKEWAQAGPVDGATYQLLFERFYSSWSNLNT